MTNRLYLLCENIEIKFAYESLIKQVNIDLNMGEKIALVGANGTGKTSLLRVLAGLSKPSSGHVFCMQEQIWPKRLSSFEHHCIFLNSQPSLLLDQSVLWNLDFYCSAFSLKKNKSDYIEALNKVGLQNKSELAVRLLSTGQKRRFTLASLILNKPAIVLADEPTNGLDEQGINLCLDIFNELNSKNNTAFLIATHDKKMMEWCHKQINIENFSPKSTKEKRKIGVLL